jgi:UDP-N-acetylmuramyl pentapeptide phosphotransferase/UDP-N-acetylglucosamine-1-phosphate transferase
MLLTKTKTNIKIITYFTSTILLWLIIGSIFTIDNTYHIVAILLAIIGFLKPKYGLYILLFSLPLFGDRPSGVQVHYLVLYSSYLLFAMYTNLILNKSLFKRFIAKIRINNIVLMFIYLYIIVSFLSLIGLPILGMIKKTLSEDILYIFKNILSVGETTLFSSVQSVFLLFQGFLFGLYIYGVSNKDKLLFYKYIILSILLGLIFSIVVGHLAFFGIYDLSWYRISDGVSIGRIHSFFVNSSWYSQYLAILLPLVPIVLLFIKNIKVSILVIVLLVVLGEVTLILSMQRGAWITYPPTLLLVWVSIYYVIAKIKDRNINLNIFLKKNWFKILITIPLTVVMSIYIVYSIKDYRKNHNVSTVDTFMSVSLRAQNITKSNDRLKHWPPAIKLWQQNPIFGGGGDSFGWQYKIYYYEEGARFKGSITDTLAIGQWGTTHNLYLQTLVGKGIFGLLFLIGFIFILVFMLIKKEILDTKNRNINKSVISLVILGNLSATIIYANVQEIFYIQSVSVIFWVMIFMGLSISFEKSNKINRKKLKNIFLYTFYLMLILLPFHIFNISYIKDFINKKIPFFSGDFLDTIIWIVLAIFAYTIYMQKKIIKHSELNSLFIDCDKSNKPQMFHKKPTPRSGGIGIYLGGLFFIFNPLGWKILIVSLPTFIVGLYDDFSSISPKIRLFVQALSAILSVIILDYTITNIGFSISIPYMLGAIICILAVTGITNAINIIDGFNGLASGIVVFSLLSMGFISWILQDIILFEIIIISIIAVLGFMIFNYPKGKIFLGDGGAFYLGFLISVLVLLLIFRNDNISIYYSLSLLIYPVFEVLFSMYRRKILKGKSFIKNDALHFHTIIHKRITKNNPKTSKFIWIRVLPFMIFSTIFYTNDLLLILNIIAFALYYIYTYRKIVKFKYQ